MRDDFRTQQLTTIFYSYHPLDSTAKMQSNTAPAQAMSGANISKRRKFIADGVFYAELNEFFQRELAEEGYSGVEVRVTPTVTDIIIRATHTQEVLGEQGRRIREVRLTTYCCRNLCIISQSRSSPA